MIPLFRIGAGIKLVILIAMLVPACSLTCISSWSPLIPCVVTPLAEDSFSHSVFVIHLLVSFVHRYFM